MIILASIPAIINSQVLSVQDPPLGLGYIAAFLKQNGWDVKVLDFVVYPLSLSQIAKNILKNKPNVVGFTCYNSNYNLIKQIAMKLKKTNSKLTIIIGGPTPTFSTTEIFQDTNIFDFLVRGEEKNHQKKELPIGLSLRFGYIVSYVCSSAGIEKQPNCGHLVSNTHYH